MSEIKLLLCPFCGGEVKLDEDEFYMFCCDTCGAGITFAKELPDGTAEDCNKEESIEKWNTRKPMDDIVEQLGNEETEWCDKYCEEKAKGNIDLYIDGFGEGLTRALQIVRNSGKE